MDLTQRILETVGLQARDQAVSAETLADVLRTGVPRALDVLAGEGPLSRDELRRACEYLEIDLDAALGLPPTVGFEGNR